MLITLYVDDAIRHEIGRGIVNIPLSDYEQVSETVAHIKWGHGPSQKIFRGEITPYWSREFSREMHYTTIKERIS